MMIIVMVKSILRYTLGKPSCVCMSHNKQFGSQMKSTRTKYFHLLINMTDKITDVTQKLDIWEKCSLLVTISSAFLTRSTMNLRGLNLYI